MLRTLSLMLVLVPAVAFSAPLPPPEAAPEGVELPPMPYPPAVAPAPVPPPPPGYGNPPYYGQYPQYAPPPYGYDYRYGAYPQPCYPQPACAQPTYPPPQPQAGCCPGCCATGHVNPGAWRTVIGDDGAWYRERDVRKGNAGLIATGLIMWLGGWVGTGWGGTMHDGAVGAISFFPFIGPLVSASIQSSDHHDGSSAGYVIGGLTQITGFVLFIAGAASKHVVRERQRISFGAAPTRDGFASNLSVRF